MAEKKKMTTAEILAAARKESSAAPPEPTPPRAAAVPAEPAAEESTSPAETPAAKPAAPSKPGAKPSISEILAMARAGKAGGAPAPAAPAAKAAPTAKAAPAKAAAKAKTEGAAPKPAAGGAPAVRDTSSILAAARAAAKPGPMTKAEAATLAKPTAPTKPAKGEAAVAVPPMPAKPEYAKPKPAKSDEAPEGRRVFMFGVLFGSFMAAGFSAMAATTGLWTLAFLRFMFPNVLNEPPSKFKIGFPSDFPPGSVDEKFKAQSGVWVVNAEYQGQRQIVALKTVCTHLGCTPNWLEAEQKFKCPCHGSGFYKDGINFEGPAPRPLERYAIRVADDGQLEVDKSRTFQEELGQWGDAASFVQV